ncbi:uncharacterized protein LOC103791629 [Callithrix jacchus]
MAGARSPAQQVRAKKAEVRAAAAALGRGVTELRAPLCWLRQRGLGALRAAQRQLQRSAPPRGALPGSTRRACLMLQRELRFCLEIRTRHHVNRRGESSEDMRAPGAQAGLGEPGLGGQGPGWGRGGVGPRREGSRGGGGARRWGRKGEQRGGAGVPEAGTEVRVGDARRPSPGGRESAESVETPLGSRLLLEGWIGRNVWRSTWASRKRQSELDRGALAGLCPGARCREGGALLVQGRAGLSSRLSKAGLPAPVSRPLASPLGRRQRREKELAGRSSSTEKKRCRAAR